MNKYYLDYLYEKVIVHAIAHPIARGDVLDQPARHRRHRQRRRPRRRQGRHVALPQRRPAGRRRRGQRVGLLASESGHALQPVQSGKVNQYGALLFGGAMVGGIVLVILNV